jgi:hypothetical protein
MFVRRALIAAGAAIVVAGTLGASPASAAGKPEVVRNPPSTVSVDLHDRCDGFTVRADVTYGWNTVVIFGNGTLLTTGAINATLTNLSTGTSIKINVSGQGRFHMDSELMYAHGPWELDVSDDISTPQFDGKLIFVNGNTVFSTATTDVLSSTTQVRDLCAELAA